MKKYKKGQKVQYQIDRGSPQALKPSVGTISKIKKMGNYYQYTIQDGGPVPVWGAEIIGVAMDEKVLYRTKSLGLEIIESNEPIIFQEAEYQGRKVKLGKVQRGGKKKFQVYVRDPKTKNVKKVSFGDTTGLSIKTKDPARRKSFKARHNCDNPGPRTKARYWSCRMWSGPDAVKNMLKK
tara:strand:- start:183 stop:722 length:540 start_codon:yes stop_codon:yes gene_type:complete